MYESFTLQIMHLSYGKDLRSNMGDMLCFWPGGIKNTKCVYLSATDNQAHN